MALAVAACSNDSSAPVPPPPPPPPQKTIGPATGSWLANGPSFIAALDLSDTILVTTGVGTIAGSGSITGPSISGGTIVFTVGGTDTAGSIRLILTATGRAPAYFSGQMLADTSIQGNLDSAGFAHVPLTFTHHPIVDSLSLAPRNDSLLPGRTRQFTAFAFDLLGRPLAGQAVNWSTSDTSLATISPTGLLTAHAPGVVTVQAKHDSVVAQVSLKLLRPVATVVVHPPLVSMVVPTTLVLSTKLLDSTGVEITGRTISWTSLNTAVARITAPDSVKASAPGSADVRVTAVLDQQSGIAHVTVRTTELTHLAGGEAHTCGIDSDSTVSCWGEGLVGQLGAALRTQVASPLFVAGGLHFKFIAAGHTHTCGLTADSAAYCWGGDGSGQLGDGDFVPDTVPVAVTGGLHFASIAVGYDHTCGIVSGGAAYCWGLNLAGQLGTGSYTPDISSAPLPVAGGLAFTTLAAGSQHTCGLVSDSTAYCWGANDFGMLGDSTTTSRTAPTAVAGGLRFATIATRNYHTCAITGGGAAYCWGSNNESQLGDSGSAIQQNVPVAVHGGITFTSIAAGYNHVCARATSGDIYCWGGNENGQVGPNAGTTAQVPVPVGLSGSDVATGAWHSCAITTTGAYCWGYNQVGQLGSGTSGGHTTMPVRVSGQP